MVHYYDKQSAKVALSHELTERGWKIYGFTEDQSDMMTDYYSPAHWDGIAEKNGFVLVIDQYSTHYSGYEVKKYDYSKTRSTSSKVAKLEATINDKAATEAEKETARQLVEKLNKKGSSPDYEVLKVYPTFQHKTPKACIWHIEKDGQIIAKGKGLYSLYSINDREGTKQNMKEFADKLEKHVNADTQLVAVQKEVKKKVTKIVESDCKELILEKTLLKLNSNFTGGHYKGNTFILSSEYEWKSGKTVNLVKLGKKHQVLKGTETNTLTLKYDKLLKWIEDGTISIVELKEVEEIEVKTVYVKAKRQQKTASTEVQLETTLQAETVEEVAPVTEVAATVETTVTPEKVDVTMKLNAEKNGVELYFNSIPSEDVRNSLKNHGFRWSRYSKCWYAKQSENTLALAEQLTNGTQTTEAVEPLQVEILEFDNVEQYAFSDDLERRLIDNSLINNKTVGYYTKDLQTTFSQWIKKAQDALEYATHDYERNKVIRITNSTMKNYFNEYHSYLYTKSNNPSWVVTGRGGLNASKYNKKQDQIHNKLGKVVAISDKFKKDIESLYYQFKKNSIKAQDEMIQEAMKNTDISISFQTTKRKINYHGYTYDTRSYEGSRHFMMKVAACYRIFDKTTGKEVHSFKTTTKLDEAKRHLLYLEHSQAV